MRIIIGPLPLPVCQLIIVSTRMVLWSGVMLIAMITLTRFMFICVWRRMRQMNDNLLAKIIVREIVILSFFFSLTNIRGGQDQYLCTGLFDVNETNAGKQIFINLIFIRLNFAKSVIRVVTPPPHFTISIKLSSDFDLKNVFLHSMYHMFLFASLCFFFNFVDITVWPEPI